MMRACALALFALLGSARAQRSGGTVDCTDIATLFADVNTKCCNGGGHRRAQGYTQGAARGGLIFCPQLLPAEA